MYKLRQYQLEAVNSALHHFRKGSDPAVIVLPTGAGKSLVIAELARLAKGRVLVLAHVKELVQQNHRKYESYGLTAGIYAAGLNKKESGHKVIFGSIQSVARAGHAFFEDFTLLIIDECHRVSEDSDTQYAQVIKKLREHNKRLCILGLTATPYRLGKGWIFNTSHRGEMLTSEERFFKRCVYELSLGYMIRHGYLTPPIKVDIPVTCYDFSELSQEKRAYTMEEIEDVLSRQRHLTPLILKNIVDITESYDRRGVMIFCSTVKHAQEILNYLPDGQARIVLGETEGRERTRIIEDFKQRKFKYLVNVSVLTTGFDAPHVDVIAILRPTESTSLFQQIVGRGLRLYEGKKDCIVLDYTGIDHNIYTPQIHDKKPTKESVPVPVECPECSFVNTFWGIVDADGDIVEHFGRKCRGGSYDPKTAEFQACRYRFRFKVCEKCSQQNDLSARQCDRCGNPLVDAQAKLQQAKLSRDAHVLRPDSIEMSEGRDRSGNPFLQVKYYDFDARFLSEIHYVNNLTAIKKFNINFLRSHMKRPELRLDIRSVDQIVRAQSQFRMPAFVIGRKQGKFWKITEKIFAEELI